MESRAHENWIKQGSTGILTLPSSRGNYLDDPEFLDLEWLRAAFSEPGLKGIILRGSGRHFSAGADLEKLRLLAKERSALEARISAGKEIIRLIGSTPLPVIAAISGVCFGGGLEIALACHIRICSENALFAFPETNLQIMPGLGGTITLPRLIGPGRAVEMILSGDMMNSRKALETGLVNRVVADNDLYTFTGKYLEKLTEDKEVEVIRSVMTAIHHAMHLDFDRALKEETRLFCELAVNNLKSDHTSD